MRKPKSVRMASADTDENEEMNRSNVEGGLSIAEGRLGLIRCSGEGRFA